MFQKGDVLKLTKDIVDDSGDTDFRAVKGTEVKIVDVEIQDGSCLVEVIDTEQWVFVHKDELEKP